MSSVIKIEKGHPGRVWIKERGLTVQGSRLRGNLGALVTSFQSSWASLSPVPKGWIDLEIELVASSPLYSPRHGKAQILKTGFKGNRIEQGWKIHKFQTEIDIPSTSWTTQDTLQCPLSLPLGISLECSASGPSNRSIWEASSEETWRQDRLWFPRLCSGGILQLTGEVKAALQTCKEQSTVSGANCLPDVTFQPHSSTPGSWSLRSHPQPSPDPGVRNYKFHRQLSSIWMRRRLRERNSVLCITQIMRDVFREGK